MNLPQGRLLRQRVLSSPETVLTGALDRRLTGYARLEPQETLLLSADRVGVVTFVDGVPVAAYHTAPDASGTDALTEIASSGPYRLGLYELEESALDRIHESESARVPPEMPARVLGGDQQLIERTRQRAPNDRLESESNGRDSLAAVEAFLENEQQIEAIRDRAQSEAESRADEWNLPVE
ncbi:hypothetical protein GRX03_03730 [Halovenus sp. WSH3]|uniref:DUF8054 domain-containing protein n=1 Tax=Halovenus carboxidivorans TaxID=2692199 RepID=A0A6B0T0H2_9EURY|nr:hypothetical protein [Halovenus carboxidivorans]MXR50717.1 hypothetical protein [Halovenus carboxidivorans]